MMERDVSHIHVLGGSLHGSCRHPAVLIYRTVSKRTNLHQADDEAQRQARLRVDALLGDINKKSAEAASSGLLDREKYVIPPHLHDLQEADLPETQRGLVMTEIAQFRERAAKREREKMRDVRDQMPNVLAAPSGPKVREWGKPQAQSQPPESPGGAKGFGKGAQGYSKPVGFVKADEGSRTPTSDRQTSVRPGKTDEELEEDRREARRRDEENSYKDVSVCIAEQVWNIGSNYSPARTSIRTSRARTHTGARTRDCPGTCH